MQGYNYSGGDSWLLSLRDVTKVYGRRQVLEIAALDLAVGERLAIVGANASGKSTLLRLLAGVTLQTSGSVRRSLTIRRMRFGFVPQTGGVNPELSVAENLRAVARLYGRTLAPELVSWPYVAKFALNRFLDEPVRNLSGGYRKLVSLAAVLSVEPQILFLDEPTSALDSDFVNVLNAVIGMIAEDLALLVVTGHVLKDVVHCTRDITLDEGRLR